jgi:hypothetical protein
MTIPKRPQPAFDVGIDKGKKQLFQFAVGGEDPLVAKPAEELFIEVKRGPSTGNDEAAGIPAQVSQVAGIEDAVALVGFPEDIVVQPGTYFFSGKIHGDNRLTQNREKKNSS